MVLDSARAGVGVLVRIESVNAGASADSTGHYRLVVPAARFADGDSVTITASRIGLFPERRRIQLTAGASLRADFGIKKHRPEDAFVCDGVFGAPTGAVLLPRIFYYKLCRMTDAVTRKLRGRSLAEQRRNSQLWETYRGAALGRAP